MPYLKPDERKQYLDKMFDCIQEMQPKAAEIVYLTSRLLGRYVLKVPNPGWLDRATALAITDAIAKEYYRRCMAGYEDVKIQENGDVPEYAQLSTNAPDAGVVGRATGTEHQPEPEPKAPTHGEWLGFGPDIGGAG